MKVVSLTTNIPLSNKNLYRVNLSLSIGHDNQKYREILMNTLKLILT